MTNIEENIVTLKTKLLNHPIFKQFKAFLETDNGLNCELFINIDLINGSLTEIINASTYSIKFTDEPSAFTKFIDNLINDMDIEMDV